MPGVAVARVGKAKPFSLRINNNTVDRFVEADSFGGYKQQCEGEAIFDFWTDNIDITLDVSVLDFLGYNERNYHTLEKLSAEFYYYGQRVFGGVVGDVSLDKDAQSVDFELYSYGRVIKGVSGSFTRYGFTATGIAERIVAMCNLWLTNNSYTFNIDRINIDVIDFPFYKSLERTYTVDYKDNQPFGDQFVSGYFKGVYSRAGKFYLVFNTRGTAGNPNPETFSLFELNIETGLIITDVRIPIIKKTLRNYHTGNIEPVYDPKKEDENGDPLPDEDNLNEGDVDIVRANMGGFNSMVPDGAGGYLVTASPRHFEGEWFALRFVRFNVSEQDIFYCKYDEGKAGDMLRDLATMTNSLVWVGPDTTLYLQNRGGASDLSAVNPINYKSSIVKHDNDFKIPKEYLVMDDVKDEVQEYFEEYLQGIFYSVDTLIYKEEIAHSDYPALLKNLPLKPSLQQGVIKSIQYEDFVLNINTEFRADG